MSPGVIHTPLVDWIYKDPERKEARTKFIPQGRVGVEGVADLVVDQRRERIRAARLAQREEPLHEVVGALEPVVVVAQDLVERAAPVIAAGAPVEGDQRLHRPGAPGPRQGAQSSGLATQSQAAATNTGTARNQALLPVTRNPANPTTSPPATQASSRNRRRQTEWAGCAGSESFIRFECPWVEPCAPSVVSSPPSRQRR